MSYSKAHISLRTHRGKVVGHGYHFHVHHAERFPVAAYVAMVLAMVILPPYGQVYGISYLIYRILNPIAPWPPHSTIS